MVRISKLLLLALIIPGIIACDRPVVDAEDCIDYDYANCNTTLPDYAEFVIKLTINEENPKVPIWIIKGNFEVGDTIFHDTMTDVLFRPNLLLEQYYSVVAEYSSNNRKIWAIDGDNHYFKSFNVCDSICHVVKEGKAVVELEY